MPSVNAPRAPHRVVLFATVVACLFVTLALAAPASASQTEFSRRYEASSAFVYGDTDDFAFFGTLVCSPYDSIADTGACVPYREPNAYDHRGKDVTVTIDDFALGSSAWFIVGIDMDGDRVIRCTQQNGPDVCAVAQGSVTVTVPMGATGDILRVFPATVKASGLFCCPQSAATTGWVDFSFQ